MLADLLAGKISAADVSAHLLGPAIGIYNADDSVTYTDPATGEKKTVSDKEFSRIGKTRDLIRVRIIGDVPPITSEDDIPNDL